MFILRGSFPVRAQVMPLLATATGSSVHEMSLGDVESTLSGNSMLTDGKLDLVMVTVPEEASVQVQYPS